MPRIFISYRRGDSAYIADTINQALQKRFGLASVFFDVDAIPLGVDFRATIANAVGQCDVLLAIIGDRWLGDPSHQHRLDDPADYVRIEVESALERGIPVIPVLVGNATIPSDADLPESMRGLRYRNAAEVRAGRDLQQHLERLVRGVESTYQQESKTQEPLHQDETADALEVSESTHTTVAPSPPAPMAAPVHGSPPYRPVFIAVVGFVVGTASPIMKPMFDESHFNVIAVALFIMLLLALFLIIHHAWSIPWRGLALFHLEMFSLWAAFAFGLSLVHYGYWSGRWSSGWDHVGAAFGGWVISEVAGLLLFLIVRRLSRRPTKP